MNTRPDDRTLLWRTVAVTVVGLVVALVGADLVAADRHWGWVPALVGLVAFAWGMSGLRERATRRTRRRP